MKNNLIILGIAIVVIAGIVIFGGKNDTQQNIKTVKSSSPLIAESLEYDFGDIDIFGGKVSTDYVLTNTGSEDIVVTEGVTSCGCTDGEIGGQSFGMHFGIKDSVTIPAGESIALTAIYDPLAHGPNATGAVTRMVKIMTNSTETPELEVRFTANVTKEEVEQN
ncbi:DUF1573 domain-containing protein [Candidatus Parcubacteria bacterium]|nr:DUF1573 domain-containing protein [Candidatus Parcubacteria bacterium]